MEEKKISQEESLKKQKELEEEREREEILRQANDIKEETFDFGVDGQIELKNEIADLTLEQIDNPEAKYELLYKVLNRLLKKYLPKGEEHQAARNFIYEEKNTFLTRGHRKNSQGIRGADSRMAYIPDIDELINIVTNWITNKGTVFELYTDLRELNKSKGYGTREE